jgi:RNA polymerase sigma-70 factor (ECF subfamily)
VTGLPRQGANGMGSLPAWADLEPAVPQIAATMRRYLTQIGCLLRPGSVSGAGLAPRCFAGFLAGSAPEVTGTAQVTRRHIEDYKPWLARRPGQNKPRLTTATIAHRPGTLRKFFVAHDASEGRHGMKGRSPAMRRICCGRGRRLSILLAVLGDRFAVVLARAQEGNEAAFSQLWRDSNPALLRYLRVIAPDVAEDVAAETWVQVVRGLSAFRGEESAWRAWLFTTARRRAIDDVRRRSRRPEAPLREVAAGQLPRTADAADLAVEHFGTRWVIALLAQLPRLQAEVILLRVVAGLDSDAVAQMMGRSPGAVRVAAHRGLRRLAQILEQAGVTL